MVSLKISDLRKTFFTPTKLSHPKSRSINKKALVLAQLTNALVNKTKIRIDIADMCDFDADFFFFFANCASKSLISLCLVIERILSTN